MDFLNIFSSAFSFVDSLFNQAEQNRQTQLQYNLTAQDNVFEMENVLHDADRLERQIGEIETGIDNVLEKAEYSETLMGEQLNQIIGQQNVAAAAGGIKSTSGGVKNIEQSSRFNANRDIRTMWKNVNDNVEVYRKRAEGLREDVDWMRTTAADFYKGRAEDLYRESIGTGMPATMEVVLGPQIDEMGLEQLQPIAEGR